MFDRPDSQESTGSKSTGLSKSELDALVEEATVDAYGEEEQVIGFFTMIEDNLEIPFETTILGVKVEVESVDLVGQNTSHIVAICRRGRHRQAIPITALPAPSSPPEGMEWIEAYRHWMGE